MTAARPMSCAEADELAALFVLEALGPEDGEAVQAHLASCPEPHRTFAELAAAVAAMPLAVERLDAPAGTRDRVLSAVANTPQVPDWPAAPVAPAMPAGGAEGPAPVSPSPALSPPAAGTSWRDRVAGGGDGSQERRTWRWAGLAASALAIVLVAVGVLGSLQRELSETDRLQLLRGAMVAAADPATTVAPLTGSGSAAGAAGYAVFPPEGEGYVVVDGLPAIGEGLAYQVWFVGTGDPVSAGLIDLGRDGLGALTGLDLEPGTAVVALSVEERPGASAPTTDPVVAGEVRTAA